MLAHGADPNQVGLGYPVEFPLYLAAANGRPRCVEALLRGNANVNLVTTGQHTSSLHVATRNGHVEVVKMLLEAKAHVNAQDKLLKTAIHDAARNANEPLVSCLIAYRADVNCMDIDLIPPLNHTLHMRHDTCKPVHPGSATCACYAEVT